MGFLLGRTVERGYVPSFMHKLLRPHITGNEINGVCETTVLRPTPIYHWLGKLRVPFNRVQLSRQA